MVKTPTLIGRGIYRYSQSSTNQRPQCKAPSNPALPAPESAVWLHPSFTGSRDRLQNIPPHGRCTHRWKCRRRNNTGPLLLLGDSLSFPVTGSNPSWSFRSQTHKKNSHQMAGRHFVPESAWIGFTCPFLARQNVVAMGCIASPGFLVV